MSGAGVDPETYVRLACERGHPSGPEVTGTPGRRHLTGAVSWLRDFWASNSAVIAGRRDEVGQVDVPVDFGGEPARAAVWAEWAVGVISIATAGGWLDVNGTSADHDLPLPAPFHVITAHEPFGHRLSSAETAAAAARLEEEVAAMGVPYRRASGHSADWSHDEPSIAVAGLSRRAARDLGARYLQEAVYEVTADQVLVVACSHDLVVAVDRLRGGTASR